MDFSPIAQIRVKNFRNIGDVTLSFEESPIVTLMGENEAGKTSIVKALAVAGANAYPARQAKFIRTGTSGFGIQVSFKDGSYLMRQKGGPGIGNRLKVRLADGTELQDDKLDRGEGIPVNMEKLMGFMVEPETGELLNVRTYEDALMFVTTPDSANYKVLYNALKVGQVTRAIKAGNKEVSGLRQEIDANSVRMDGIQATLKNIRIVDMAPLEGIRARLEKELSNLEKLEQAMVNLKSLQSARTTLGALVAIEENGVKPVDTRTAEMFTRAVSDKDGLSRAEFEANSLSQVVGIEAVRMDTLETLSSAVNELQRYSECGLEVLKYQDVSRIEPIDTGAVTKMASAKTELSRYEEAKKTSQVYSGLAGVKNLDTVIESVFVRSFGALKDLDNEKLAMEGLKKDTEECVSAIHEAGGNVGVCSNCGHWVVVKNFPKSEVG